MKVDDAFRLYKYVPYSSLTSAARLKASRGEEDFIINASGGLTTKALDRKDEQNILLPDWLEASATAEERIHFHHGEARASALAKHHRIVTDLAHTHPWSIAIEYNIRQREMAACRPEHDLSSLDDKCLMLVVTTLMSACNVPEVPLATPLAKRSRIDSNARGSRKRLTRMCFRCSFAGHLPADCKAETTSAGRTPMAISSDAQSKHALIGPNGKHFCFNWARDSTCQFSDKCHNHHGCSLCGSTSHGAGTCRVRS